MDPKERQELIDQLERESAEYLASLKPSKYTEGWKEETWEKEMEEHPLFATKLPENAEMPPLVEALQQLKYDAEVNGPEDLAEQYKEDGNNNFRLKKYRWAVASYTEGIKQKCSNPELNAQLLCNRAAAHFRLENYGSALSDAVAALKLKPTYVKAMTKAALCCWELKKLQRCLELCEEILKLEPNNSAIEELRDRAEKQKKIDDRNKRRELQKAKAEAERKAALKAQLLKRGIKIPKDEEGEADDALTPLHPALADYRVRLAGNGEDLVWPVMFLYPEVMDSDYIQQFEESSTFQDHLSVMFEVTSEQPEWNSDRRYRPDGLSIWYKDMNRNALVSVSPGTTLRDVIFDERFSIQHGTPTFWIIPSGSEFEAKFISENSTR